MIFDDAVNCVAQHLWFLDFGNDEQVPYYMNPQIQPERVLNVIEAPLLLEDKSNKNKC
jgi:hypothetical protein